MTNHEHQPSDRHSIGPEHAAPAKPQVHEAAAAHVHLSHPNQSERPSNLTVDKDTPPPTASSEHPPPGAHSLSTSSQNDARAIKVINHAGHSISLLQHLFAMLRVNDEHVNDALHRAHLLIIELHDDHKKMQFSADGTTLQAFNAHIKDYKELVGWLLAVAQHFMDPHQHKE
jgi:hypothetical protein